MSAPDDFATAAEEMVGTRFRLHGRCALWGVDCIGLVVCALAASGRQVASPAGYGLRNSDIADHLACVVTSGFVAVRDSVRRGDLLLAIPGPAQHHVLIATARNGFVHAHAGLRRVVRQRGPADWPIAAHWRLEEI